MKKTNNKEREEAIKFKIMTRLWKKCCRRQEQNEHLLSACDSDTTYNYGCVILLLRSVSLLIFASYQSSLCSSWLELTTCILWTNHIRNIRTKHYLVEFELTVAIFVTETNLHFELYNAWLLPPTLKKITRDVTFSIFDPKVN